METWNLIVQSNAFNFIIMIVLLSIIVKKLDVSSKLAEIKEKIVTQIDMSKLEREKTNTELQKAKEAVANLDHELQELTEQTLKNIENTTKQTMENAQIQAQSILDNVQTVIENEEKQISAQILRATTTLALKTAKDNIVEKLRNNPELHNKYIDEAIENVDEVTLQ